MVVAPHPLSEAVPGEMLVLALTDQELALTLNFPGTRWAPTEEGVLVTVG